MVTGIGVVVLILAAWSSSAPIDATVEFQPFVAQVRRVVEALDLLGEPLPPADRDAALAACRSSKPDDAVRAMQQTLDKHVLAVVTINAESRVKVERGPAPGRLMQNGWRSFLVKVLNEGGVTAPLLATSPNAAKIVAPATNRADPPLTVTPADVVQRFLEVKSYDKQPLEPTLSGLRVEYRILQLYCRDEGKREASLAFSVGPGTQDGGFRAETHILFHVEPAVEVTLSVHDVDGSPTTASFTFRDQLGRVYPAQSRRLAPDFFFQPQVYRADGESLRLPPGRYTVDVARGPEYRLERRTVEIPVAARHRESFLLRRWIEPKKLGWWSGDHHVHGAGCAHYDNPTQGVTPADMFRHIVGEDLNVGCVLSWGPCWYYQKRFFEGKISDLSQKNHLMRYDVEVSGFPSSHCGHLCLLNLQEDDYPNAKRLEQWPSWDLPVLQWAKAQGAVVGFSHSAPGLNVPTFELPNYKIPPFDGIGANEYIVDVAHDACDFISTVDTQAPWELNIWYHTLNCGFRCRISGETDFPCIFGQRVGIGRVYVQLPGALAYQPWVEGVKAGRSYVSDGLSHLLDFKVDDVLVGGQRDLAQPGKVIVTAKAAALLADEPDEAIRRRSLEKPPYWHVERARIDNTRTVPVELVVNGRPVARQVIAGDGQLQDVRFEVLLEQSGWVALRIYPSSHTNPVFVQVAGKPIRASRRSAEWCLKCVDACWAKKSPQIRPAERPAARAAYDAAKIVYQRLMSESLLE